MNLSSLDVGMHENQGLLWTVPLQNNLELSAVDQESLNAVSRGKPSVAQTLQALPTHASDICLQCSSLPAAQLNK